MAENSNDDEVAELTTFQSREAYVYAPLPPATSYGHRAELWDVNKWLREVRVRVVMSGEACYVRLEDDASGELFAECPLPGDGAPLTTAVEPVVDSSRYFVVRVADRADARKHAFIGVGFRERAHASDFAAALDDYRQIVRRGIEAAAMRARFEGAAGASASGSGGEAAGKDGGGGGPAGGGIAPGEDLRLRESITLKLSIKPRGGSGESSDGDDSRRTLSRGLSGVSAAMASGSGAVGLAGLKLPPPPAAGGLKLAPPPRPAAAVSQPAATAAVAAAPAAAPAAAAALAAVAATDGSKTTAVVADDEDWADFQS